jgi:hypothetical protein
MAVAAADGNFRRAASLQDQLEVMQLQLADQLLALHGVS